MKALIFRPKKINPTLFGFCCALALYALLFFALLSTQDHKISIQENGNQTFTLKLTKSSIKAQTKQEKSLANPPKPKQTPIPKNIRKAENKTIKQTQKITPQNALEQTKEVAQNTPPKDISSNTKADTQAEQEIEALAYNQGVTDDFLSKIHQAISNNNSYPRIAKIRGLEGDVIIGFCLNIDGSLEELQILQSTADTLLNTTALKAVSKASKSFPKPTRRVRIKVPISYHFAKK
ncbi:hypothetical protein BBW65_02850 [Helicobacter enhydrae]|uniref:TonB C-terminal domain-containing protein n=1 Tax=Helicobacter enhydrae TaxID=222136 RepID=A0A1B1U4X4_9HELI|nr:energy transducer TonB [Helicobacter enhydrae]ANV97806.1 hypothetical protein BBW65_02850 [Helicobacter enhydrae]